MRQRFFEGACEIVKACGGTEIPSNSSRRNSFEICTRYGRLEIHVGEDRVVASFDRPHLSRVGTDCNPYSGKWNHHYFAIGREAVSAEFVDDCLSDWRTKLERVEPRPFVRRDVVIDLAEAAEIGQERLLDREAFGEVITIDGFDRRLAVTEMMDAGPAADDADRSFWGRETLDAMGDVRLHFGFKQWQARQRPPSIGMSMR